MAIENAGTNRKPMKLDALMKSANIAEDMEDTVIADLASRVKEEYESDKQSRVDWEKKMDIAIDLTMQKMEEKSYPWPKAANVKHPLITKAAIEFSARAYPAVINERGMVKAAIHGEDPQGLKAARGMRVSNHMSWQLFEDMDSWDEGMDIMFMILPIMGCGFKKTYYNTETKKNCSDWVHPYRFVVDYEAKDMNMRATEEVYLYPHEIRERINSGIYLDANLGIDYERDYTQPKLFLEQHRLFDLDGDGYPEPYIVTLHKDSGQIVRVFARYDEESIVRNEAGDIIKIKPIEYYTRYIFMHAPDGGFYGLGFGILLTHTNVAINSAINQMLDAGHLQNAGGGFIGSGLKGVTGGDLRFRPGEFKKINNAGVSIRDNIYHMEHAGPSPVLFQLLGFMVEAGREIANTKDILDATSMSANMPATTTMAIVEQGMVQYGAIFKRIFRGLKMELKKLYRLNRVYMDPKVYFTYQDKPQVAMQADYAQDLDIVPTADPKSVSDMQKLTRANFLMQFKGDPTFDAQEINRRMLEAAGVPDIDKLFAKQPQSPPPDVQLKIIELEHKEEELSMNLISKRATAIKDIALAMKAVAEAESLEIGNQSAEYAAVLNQLGQEVLSGGSEQNPTVGGAGIAPEEGMGEPPDNAGVQEPLEAGEAGPTGEPGVGPIDEAGGMGNASALQ